MHRLQHSELGFGTCDHISTFPRVHQCSLRLPFPRFHSTAQGCISAIITTVADCQLVADSSVETHGVDTHSADGTKPVATRKRSLIRNWARAHPGVPWRWSVNPPSSKRRGAGSQRNYVQCGAVRRCRSGNPNGTTAGKGHTKENSKACPGFPAWHQHCGNSTKMPDLLLRWNPRKSNDWGATLSAPHCLGRCRRTVEEEKVLAWPRTARPWSGPTIQSVWEEVLAWPRAARTLEWSNVLQRIAQKIKTIKNKMKRQTKKRSARYECPKNSEPKSRQKTITRRARMAQKS